MEKVRQKKGFTFVELIVVLVILAILAAILVPALLGYVDKAKKQQDMINAKSSLIAMQAKLAEFYGSGNEVGLNEQSIADRNNKFHDVSWLNTEAAEEVLDMADVNPYMLIVGVGDYQTYKDTAPHKAYTAYFVAYWPAKDRDPIFFDGTDWTSEYPWKESGGNTFPVSGKPVSMQFYFIKAPKKSMTDNWKELKKYLNINQK